MGNPIKLKYWLRASGYKHAARNIEEATFPCVRKNGSLLVEIREGDDGLEAWADSIKVADEHGAYALKPRVRPGPAANGEPRTPLAIRFSKTERARIRKASEGTPIGTYIRNVVLGHLDALGVW